MTDKPYNPDARAHPGLHLLALFEGMKGLLALSAAISLELLGPQPLRDLINGLITKFNLDPDSGPLPTLMHAINPTAVHLVAAVLLVYAFWRLLEAWGAVACEGLGLVAGLRGYGGLPAAGSTGHLLPSRLAHMGGTGTQPAGRRGTGTRPVEATQKRSRCVHDGCWVACANPCRKHG